MKARAASFFNRPYFSIYKNQHKQDSILIRSINDIKATITYKKSFLEYIPDSIRAGVIGTTESSIRSLKGAIFPYVNDTDIRRDKITKLKIEWHKKFTLSFACLLLFLIGAPLGAIIRKGGIGMPVVVAIGFFVVYFIINSTGEKLAKQHAVAPWYGMWLATAVLLPIAFVIMTQARNDSNIFNKETYTRLWNQVKKRFKKKAQFKVA